MTVPHAPRCVVAPSMRRPRSDRPLRCAPTIFPQSARMSGGAVVTRVETAGTPVYSLAVGIPCSEYGASSSVAGDCSWLPLYMELSDTPPHIVDCWCVTRIQHCLEVVMALLHQGHAMDKLIHHRVGYTAGIGNVDSENIRVVS
jgi:hypothetical protein